MRPRSALPIRPWILLLGLLLAFVPSPSPCAEKRSPNAGGLDPREFNSFVRGFLEGAMRTCHVPGAVFVAVADDRVIASFGVGVADLESKRPMTEETVVRTASISKVITALTALSLEQRGRLSLDQDVNRYLKHIQIPPVQGWRPITIRDLLTHSGGFEDRWIGTEAQDALEELSFSRALKKMAPRRIIPPGEVYSYSNFGLALVGSAIEGSARRSFHSTVKKNVLGPLKMTKSGFVSDQAMDRDSAAGYYSAPDPYPAQYAYFLEAPAISFNSCGRDMAKLIRALLKDGILDGRQALHPKAVRELLTPAFHNHPSLPGATLGMYQTSVRGLTVLEHGGDLDGFTSLLVLVPQRSFGFFLAMNGDVPQIRDRLKEALVERYLAPPAIKPQGEPSSPVPAHLEGRYRHIRRPRTTVDAAYLMFDQPIEVYANQDGTVSVSYPEDWDRPTSTWIPLSQDLLVSLDGAERMALRRGPDGKVKFLFIREPYETYEPMHPLDGPTASRAFLWSFGVLGTASVLIWAAGALGRLKPRYDEPSEWPTKWGFISLHWLTTWAFLAGLYLADRLMGYQLRIGIPWQVKALFPLPFAGLVPLGISLYHLARPKGRGIPLDTLAFLLSLAGALGGLWFLNHWNLLGFRF